MKELFADGGVGLTGLLFFFILFVGIAAWAYHPARKQQIESLKHIPLREDDHDRA